MKTEIEIDGVKFIRADLAAHQMAESLDGKPFVIVRAKSAGVHFGYLAKKESTLAGVEVTLLNSRRVWFWSGAASLNQMAVSGVSKPSDCKIAMQVSKIDIIEVIEIVPVIQKAKENLESVWIWKV